MRTKIEIFSSQKLENFFINLENFYDVSLKSYDELDGCSNSRNLSIVFIDHKDSVNEKILNNILMNENFIFIYKETYLNEKPSLGLKKNIISFDVNQGCSGLVYGLFLAEQLLENISINNVLLICSDTYTKNI